MKNIFVVDKIKRSMYIDYIVGIPPLAKAEGVSFLQKYEY
jgi:hypothetical protein